MDNSTLHVAKQSRELKFQRSLLEKITRERDELEKRVSFLEEKLGYAYEGAVDVPPESNEQEDVQDAPSSPTGENPVEELPEDLGALQKLCTEYGIKFHAAAKTRNLQNKIREHFMNSEGNI